MPKLISPSTARNRDPIIAVLKRVLPASGDVLMIASGSGEHDVAFATAFPNLRFQPSDLDPKAVESIRAYRAEANLSNLAEPIRLDVNEETWPVDRADAIININMIHVSPWASCAALFRGARKLLSPGALLYMYGPYIIEGRPLEPSNAAFDRSLREENSAWGLRELSAVTATAKSFGFVLEETVDMPANNISVIFRQRDK